MTELTSLPLSPLLFRLRMEFLRLLPDASADAGRPVLHELIRVIEENGQSFDGAWEACCTLALVNQASETHMLRDDFFAAFANTKNIMWEVIQLARRTGSDDPELHHLEAEAHALEQKLNRLAARWQTVEDLEDLAAESIALPREKLEAVRQKYGFPQVWYDEDSKPF